MLIVSSDATSVKIGEILMGESSTSRCCSQCGKNGYNSRTCQIDVIDPRLLDS